MTARQYPCTREGLRYACADVPRAELTALPGGNAARVCGFDDLGLLDPKAARVGPTVAETAEPLREPPADATSPLFAGGVGAGVVKARGAGATGPAPGMRSSVL
ncbi:hypothetical protein [Streptomyces collinus]|uniref:hypothetical protein n=1 Tax=Streptomyces collinus TaxID=42684 RepID=UPI003EB9C351